MVDTKNAHPSKLALEYVGKVNKPTRQLSDDCVFRFFQSSPNLKKFELNNSYTSSVMLNNVWPSCLASFCPDLEFFKIHSNRTPEDGLEILSKRCHKLKSLELMYVNFLVWISY